jgi:hypothetical protein
MIFDSFISIIKLNKTMKKYLLFAASLLIFGTSQLKAQDDKSKRPSPPASVSETIKSGAVVSIDYSSPSLKGRTIGTDVEPKKDQVWRMGANEATVLTVSKDVTIDGKKLAAGKYGVWGEWNDDNSFSVFINSTSKIWGTEYNSIKDKDVLVFKAKVETGSSTEHLTYKIDKSGKVSLLWGTMVISFNIK